MMRREQGDGGSRLVVSAPFALTLALTLHGLACTGELVTPPNDGSVIDATGDASQDGPRRDAASDGARSDGTRDVGVSDGPPFACTLPATIPTLALVGRRHPTAVQAGQALTLALHSDNTAPKDAPALELELHDATGLRTLAPQARVAVARPAGSSRPPTWSPGRLV